MRDFTRETRSLKGGELLDSQGAEEESRDRCGRLR